MKNSSSSNPGLVVCRFLFLLGLSVWLGGLAFVAIGAPAMFKVSRLMGPQMVGAAMGSFTVVTYICAALILIGWGCERGVGVARSQDKAWKMQGLCIGVMIAIGAYLGAAVMPEMVSLQPTVVAQSQRLQAKLPPVNDVSGAMVKARFDRAHKTYRSATSLIVLLGLATLFLFCVRISRYPLGANGALPGREGSIFTKGAI